VGRKGGVELVICPDTQPGPIKSKATEPGSALRRN